MPADEEVVRFLDHVWAFDRLKVTAEDTQRTAMYRENIERSRFQQQAQSFDAFLAGLELRVVIRELALEHVARVAQLTQRTNQFNFTTIRRMESDVRRLSEFGKECRIVEVSDRFGDYGLVGVVIFGPGLDALQVDTFLLSCRVLGRGWNTGSSTSSGRLHNDEGLEAVEATLNPTKKNLPAHNFLDAVASEFAQPRETGVTYRIPAEHARAAAPAVGTGAGAASEEPALPSSSGPVKAPPYERLARAIYHPDRVLAALVAGNQHRRPRPLLDQPFSTPGTETEARLAEVWGELLRIEAVGIHDNYFDLGGTSLGAVDLFARIECLFGIRLPLTSIIECRPSPNSQPC